MTVIPNLGDIVAVNAHPYFKEIYNVRIAGEPTNVLPLMVVVEIHEEVKTMYHEQTGELLTEKGKGKCKCVWFSLKTNSFSESWFHFDSIKIIKSRSADHLASSNLTEDSEEFREIRKKWKNKSVNFITSRLELKKVKETKAFEKDVDKLSSYSSLLSFVCPPLEVIEVKLTSIKVQSVFDTKTGKRKHHHPKVDFKVRYYNAASDKWSVSMLPLECFEPIEDVSEQVAILSSDIEKGVTYQVDVSLLEPILQSQFSEPFALLEPREVSYINGSYTLKAYDWIQNKTLVLDIPLPDFAAQISKDNLFLGDAFPDFDFTEGSRAPAWEGLFTEFNDFIAKYSDEKNYLVLTYINRAGNVTTRTIKDYFVVPKSTKTSSDYLQAYCCKKKERRSFRYDRIQSIKVLNLKV